MCWQVSIALFRGIHRLLTRQITVRTMNSTDYSSLLETIGNLSRSTTSELKSLSRFVSCRWFWKVFLSAFAPVCILYTCVFCWYIFIYICILYIYIYAYTIFVESLSFSNWRYEFVQMLMPQSIPTRICHLYPGDFCLLDPKPIFSMDLVSFCMVFVCWVFLAIRAVYYSHTIHVWYICYQHFFHKNLP